MEIHTDEPETQICGNGCKELNEGCDDGNRISRDGCSSNCNVEKGYKCPFDGKTCLTSNCGDGCAAFNEECDEGLFNYFSACDVDCKSKI